VKVLAVVFTVLATLLPPSVLADEVSQNVLTIALQPRSAERPIRRLAIAPEELGTNWFVIPESVEEVDIQHLGRAPRPSDPLASFQARYRNETDFQPGREIAPLVAQFQDRAQTAKAMREYLDFIVMGNHIPEVRWRWHAEDVATGDQGVRFAYSIGDVYFAGYLFRIDTYLGGVLVRGNGAAEEALLADATLLAQSQESILMRVAPLA
jgi:hypothetical protein